MDRKKDGWEGRWIGRKMDRNKMNMIKKKMKTTNKKAGGTLVFDTV
jgi:hypothetical protein